MATCLRGIFQNHIHASVQLHILVPPPPHIAMDVEMFVNFNFKQNL